MQTQNHRQLAAPNCQKQAARNVSIAGKLYPLNLSETRVFYRGGWEELREDQAGGIYIQRPGETTIYLDEVSQLNY